MAAHGDPSSAGIHGAGAVLPADLGATHARLAVCDMAGSALAEEAHDIAIADGPERVMDWLEGRFDALLAAAPAGSGQLLGIGVGAPRPGEHPPRIPHP